MFRAYMFSKLHLKSMMEIEHIPGMCFQGVSVCTWTPVVFCTAPDMAQGMTGSREFVFL